MLASRCHASHLLSTGYYLLATSCLLPFTSYFLLVANYYTTYWQHLFCILPPAFTYDLPRTQHIPLGSYLLDIHWYPPNDNCILIAHAVLPQCTSKTLLTTLWSFARYPLSTCKALTTYVLNARYGPTESALSGACFGGCRHTAHSSAVTYTRCGDQSHGSIY